LREETCCNEVKAVRKKNDAWFLRQMFLKTQLEENRAKFQAVRREINHHLPNTIKRSTQPQP